MTRYFVLPIDKKQVPQSVIFSLLNPVFFTIMVLGSLLILNIGTVNACRNGLDLQKKRIIVETLFNLKPGTADEETFYDYNSYECKPEWEGKVSGYIGGHSGWDAQTQNVAGAKPPQDVRFYSLTVGKVIRVGGNYNTIAVYNADDEKTTLYLHAKRVFVEEGDSIVIGTCLGIQGNAGIARPKTIPENYKNPPANPDDYPENYMEHVHVEVRLGMHKGSATGAVQSMRPISYLHQSIVENQFAPADVNRNGQVDLFDATLVVENFGKNDPQFDINGDGVIGVKDLAEIVTYLRIFLRDIKYCALAPGSPVHNRSQHATIGTNLVSEGDMRVSQETVQQWVTILRQTDDGSLAFKEAIALLETLLYPTLPEKTMLFANYPNPFNPETWIPYYLATDTDVTITIYDATGRLVHQLNIGHQGSGYYTTRNSAAYWNGASETGEPVASGIYYYTLTTGNNNFSTRKMVILK